MRGVKKPVQSTTDWEEPDATPVEGQALTGPGRHHGAEFIARKRAENRDQQAKYLRDYGGRERDPRRVPPPEHADSGRTWKSSSKVRFPSELFRKNYDAVDWKR